PEAGTPRRILFVDDNFSLFEEMILLLQKSFLAEFSLLAWNPFDDGQKSIRDRVCSYGSLDHKGMDDIALQVRECPTEQSPAKTVLLRDLLPSLQFIVVDQLYRDDRHFELLGPELVRGFARILRDQRPAARTIPEIIALSRTASPDVINRTLQVG